MISLRRDFAAWAGCALALSATTVAIAAILAAMSGRGDLLCRASSTLIPIALAIAAAMRGRRAYHAFRDLAATARTLTTRANAPARSFRAETLAAIELADLLESPRAATNPSRELAEEYIRRVERQLIRPTDAAVPSRTRAWLITLPLIATVALGYQFSPWYRSGVNALLAAQDIRPPSPPEPLWSALTLQLDFPEHTRRPAKELINSSGALRVPAGTRMTVDIEARIPLDSIEIDANYDLRDSHQHSTTGTTAPLQREGGSRWRGSIVISEANAWSLLATDSNGTIRRSAGASIEIEPDAPPEIELLPLATHQLDVSEIELVELRFRARDDFGITKLTLIYTTGEGEPLRVELGPPPAGARQWSGRHTWDLSSVPLAARDSLEFWLEIRDNDPGLRLSLPLASPGKIAESTHLRLNVRDRESVHAANLVDLQSIRDEAIDHLAHRLLAASFRRSPATDGAASPIEEARALHQEAAELLESLAQIIDQVTVDPLTRERDAATLAGIHRRLFALHRAESEIHERFPPGAEAGAPARLRATLAALAGVHPRQIQQLEDEIIRLDDIVDDLHIDRIDLLTDRLMTAQERLIELLERLRAGDHTVEPEISQMQQRIRDDLRKIAEARARLQKEVGSDYINLDALRSMHARMDHQELTERLRRGDIAGALEQARGALDELRQLRSSVHDRLADGASPRLTPEERARMALLRDLSRIQDEERSLRADTNAIHQLWRSAARKGTSTADRQQPQRKHAEALRRSLEAINDARLSRRGRDALGDAKEGLDRVSSASDDLDAYEAAAAAAAALSRALAGAQDEDEAKPLRSLVDRADRLANELRTALPAPREIFDAAAQMRLDELARRQSALRDRSAAVLDDPGVQQLPDPGKQSLRAAVEAMESGRDLLDESASEGALEAQERALADLKRAIESLRSASPPPSGPAGAPASTESERDRSLRDQLLDAMREAPPGAFTSPVKRYYEELLR